MAIRMLQWSPRLFATALLPLVLVGCDKPQAMGRPTNIVVGAPDSVWTTLEAEIKASLEPRTFTVRDERIFDVAQADPRSQEWGNLRLVRQVLVIGEPADPWIAEALAEYDGELPTPPAVVQARNVWAQGQLVTVLLTPPAGGAEPARSLIPELGDLYLRQFERYARERMFVSGVDSVLADSLQQVAGFSLLLPQVYYYREVRPGVWVFRNDFPDPSKLIRSIEVASRPSAEVEFTAESARRWRAELARELTQPPQVTDSVLTAQERMQVNGQPALEVQGVWSNPPGEWPAAGVFLTRLVQCGERTYLVDSWLYAPGTAKYEYLVQLQTLLDTFRCQ